MVAVKAHQAQSFLKAPAANITAFLFFGSDSGLVAERAPALARMLAARETPEGEVLRLDDADLENDPARLAVELETLPMFGGRKVIRSAAGRRINANLLKPLVQGDTLAATLIVEGGNLKPDDAMRALFEKSPNAAAVACYADEAADLDTLVRDVLKSHGLAIADDARELLVARLGADRALSRNEVEKLALYASGQPLIEIADVEAVVGDAAEMTLDRIPSATASGDAARAVLECDRWAASGESPQAVVLALQRHFQRLHRIRAALDQGRPLDDAVRALRPPRASAVRAGALWCRQSSFQGGRSARRTVQERQDGPDPVAHDRERVVDLVQEEQQDFHGRSIGAGRGRPTSRYAFPGRLSVRQVTARSVHKSASLLALRKAAA